MEERRVVQYAIWSRVVIVSLIFLWRSLLSPYDTSASINPPCLNSSLHAPPLLPRVGSAIESSIVWDAVYFLRIAECGYEYEQTYAFLPFLPLSISLLSNSVFAPLVPVIGYRAVLGLSGYLLNNIAFVFTALYLCRYSESLYAFLSFGGLFHFLKGSDWYAAIWFALSGSARSNGVLNAGYICFHTMLQLHEALFIRKNFYLTLKILVSGALKCLCVFAPFISFQAYGYFNICMGHSADQMRVWCNTRLPLLYNYIQSHYWGVGFMRYFQVKQLPNFLLALPILSLALCSIIYYVKKRPELFLSLGLRASIVEKELFATPSAMSAERISSASFHEIAALNLLQDYGTVRLRRNVVSRENLVVQPSTNKTSDTQQCLHVVILPCVLHLSFMVATVFFVMHVQVATRFLSASPVLYWYASHIMGYGGAGKRTGRLIWVYCAVYILLGSLLFSNFYPFT